MSQDSEYDVLIVGGRAAGASLALLLARQGRRVIIADRDEFPSDTMSTHFMSGAAVGGLHRLGVLGDVLAAGFRRITRIRNWVGDCCFEGPSGPPGVFSLAPRRVVLDSALINRAVKAGARFLPRTRVEGLIHEDGRVAGAALKTVGGERREVRARVVVGADGRSSRVAEWVGASEYDAVPALRPAYYGYFHGVVPRDEPTVEVMFGRDQIGFLFPMREDEDCIAIEMQPEDFDDFRSDHSAAFGARVRALPDMARRMKSASLEGKIIGVKGIENYFRKPFGPGWALTGDAGYLKDPSTGTGIGDAIEQSFMLADALGAWFDGAEWETTMTAFHQRRDQAFKPMYDITLAFTCIRDLGPADQALLNAVFANPAATRMVAYGMGPLLPQILPGPLNVLTQRFSKMFAPAPEPTKA